MEDKPSKAHVTLVMPRSLYERLDEIRWQTRAASFTGLLRDLLEDCADRYEKKRGTEPELAQSEIAS